MLSPGSHDAAAREQGSRLRRDRDRRDPAGRGRRALTLDPRGRANINAAPWAEVCDRRREGRRDAARQRRHPPRRPRDRLQESAVPRSQGRDRRSRPARRRRSRSTSTSSAAEVTNRSGWSPSPSCSRRLRELRARRRDAARAGAASATASSRSPISSWPSRIERPLGRRSRTAPRRRPRSAQEHAADRRSAAPGTSSNGFIDGAGPRTVPTAPGDRGRPGRCAAPSRSSPASSSSARAADPARAIDAIAALPAASREVLHRTAAPHPGARSRGTRSTSASPRPTSTAALLFTTTGPARHVVDVLKRRGPRLSASETEVYTHAGLAYLPPETRDAPDAIDRARAGDVPRLVEREDIRGDLHMHTTYSDGRDSLRRMIAGGARARLRVHRDHRSLRARRRLADADARRARAAARRDRRSSATRLPRHDDPARHRGRHPARRHARLPRRGPRDRSTSCWRRSTTRPATTAPS